MKIAIIHDFLVNSGGAEKIFEELVEIFPQADLYSLACNKDLFPKIHKRINTTIAQYFPRIKQNHRPYFFIYPFIVDGFNLDKYDIVISSSYSFVKNVKTRGLHICYLHALPRFMYEHKNKYVKGNTLLKSIVKRIISWDKRGVSNVDHFIANSKSTQKSIMQEYHRHSIVIYPFVDTERFRIQKRTNKHYLLVSRLNIPSKRADAAIRAFNNLDKQLIVVGDGEDSIKLRRLANSNIQFKGQMNQEQLIAYYQNAKALIFPSDDAFGIACVESQSCGTPVIAFGKGGALETVIEGKTGHFFYEQTPQALSRAINEFDRMKFDPRECRKNALRFDKEIFKKKIKAFVEEKYREWKRHRDSHVGTS